MQAGKAADTTLWRHSMGDHAGADIPLAHVLQHAKGFVYNSAATSWKLKLTGMCLTALPSSLLGAVAQHLIVQGSRFRCLGHK